MTETHEIVVLKPKPSSEDIRHMVSSYFDQEAAGYDQFTDEIEKRRLFTESVDNIVAADLKGRPSIGQLLSIGAGTGKRERRIRDLSRHNFEISATDISAQMCSLMEGRGLTAVCGAWECLDLGKLPHSQFDAIFILHSFGLIASAKDRLEAVQKAATVLRKGGLLYVDVLNLDDLDEWGPRIMQSFEENRLLDSGYDPGDVIYRRLGGEALSYCHYFTRTEMEALFEQAGFTCESVVNVGYAANCGEILESHDRGSLVFVAAKI